MATTMTNDTTNNVWKLALQEQTKLLKTKDTYVDKNIKIEVADAQFGDMTGGTVTATPSTENTTYISGTATNYPVVIKADATAAAANIPVTKAGWIDDDVAVDEATGSGTATIYIKEGALQTVAGNAPVATAGLADTTYLTTTNTGYAITATADAAATSKAGVDAVATAGWVPADAAVTVTTPAATQASTTKYIKAGALKNANGGAVTATAGFDGTDYFVTSGTTPYAVTATADASAANSTTGVTTAGWIPANATATVTGQTATQATATKYIKEGGLANAGSTGVTYEDASAEGPILISGDYLYINEGYQTNKKISLAQLVPDGANISVVGGDKWVYDDKTVYDSDGKLITGTMPSAAISTTVTSATATANITAITPAYNATNKNYDVTGTGAISGTANTSASVTTSGLAVTAADNANGGKYEGLGATTATGSGNISGTASLSNVTLAAAELQAAKTADGKVTPVIADAAATGTNVAKHGTVTTTAPATGKYIAVNTAAIDATTTVTSSVKTDGYADTVNTNKPETTVTRGAAAATTAYVPITAGSVADTKADDGAVKPVIKVATGNNAAVGTLTTTKPSTGNYVAVDTSAIAASTKVTTTVTEGYVTAADSTDITVTRGASAAAVAYVPLTAATHSDTKGELASTNATATASTTVVTKAGNAVAGVLSAAPATGDYLKIDGTAAQTAAGSISQDVRCQTSVGYVGTAIDNTTTVSGTTGVTVTAAATKYIKIYDGSIE